MNGRRRCELEQAIIHAMVLGEYVLYNALGELDWEFEKEWNMEDDTVYDLNHYARLCHEANKYWWLDTSKPCECVVDGQSKDVLLFRAGIQYTEMVCPLCHGDYYRRKDRNKGELLMLCVSELAEAMEGHRKDKMDDKLPHRKMAEVELADFLIRAFDMAGGLELDLNPVGKTGLPNLNEYGKLYATIMRLDNPLNFAESLMCVNMWLVECLQKSPSAGSLRMAIVWALGIMGTHGMDIQGAFDEKMTFNAHRVDHTLQHRAGPGGKKY